MKHSIKLLSNLIVISMVLILIPSCHCNNGSASKESDSTVVNNENNDSATISMESISQKDSAKMLANIPTAHALQKVMPDHIDWKRFALIDFNQALDSTKTVTFHSDQAFYTKYATYLKASPDKAFYLDLGTDNLVEDPTSGQLMTGDPEGAVYLIDKKEGSRSEIVNLGGSGNLLESNWLDNDEVSILCTMAGKNPKKDDTYLYIYNAKTHLLRTYMLK